MRYVRVVGTVVVGCLIAVGIVRATGDSAALERLAAQARLVSTAHAAGLTLSAADPTPTVTLAKLLELAPGGSGQLAASGLFPPGSTFTLKGNWLTVTNQTVAGNQYSATVAVSPNALPGKGYLNMSAPSGKFAGAQAVVIKGTWRIDVTAANGWRIKMTPMTRPATQSDIAMKAEFFKGAETTPFEVRDAALSIPEPDQTFVISFNDAAKNDECTAVAEQMGAIGQRMTTAKTDAERERVMKDMERIQGKQAACIEKQMKDMQVLIANAQNPAYQKAEQEKADNFGCRNMIFRPAPNNAIEGNLACGKNIQNPKVTGTMKFVGP
jgi:hypothetical protein